MAPTPVLMESGEMGHPFISMARAQRVVRMCLFDPTTLPVVPVGNYNMNEGKEQNFVSLSRSASLIHFSTTLSHFS